LFTVVLPLSCVITPKPFKNLYFEKMAPLLANIVGTFFSIFWNISSSLVARKQSWGFLKADGKNVKDVLLSKRESLR
jgi:hypothetical protein